MVEETTQQETKEEEEGEGRVRMDPVTWATPTCTQVCGSLTRWPHPLAHRCVPRVRVYVCIPGYSLGKERGGGGV